VGASGTDRYDAERVRACVPPPQTKTKQKPIVRTAEPPVSEETPPAIALSWVLPLNFLPLSLLVRHRPQRARVLCALRIRGTQARTAGKQRKPRVGVRSTNHRSTNHRSTNHPQLFAGKAARTTNRCAPWLQNPGSSQDQNNKRPAMLAYISAGAVRLQFFYDRPNEPILFASRSRSSFIVAVARRCIVHKPCSPVEQNDIQAALPPQCPNARSANSLPKQNECRPANAFVSTIPPSSGFDARRQSSPRGCGCNRYARLAKPMCTSRANKKLKRRLWQTNDSLRNLG